MKEKPKRAYGFSKRAGLNALMKLIENDAYLKCLWQAEVEKYEMQTYYTVMNGHWPGEPVPNIKPIIGLTTQAEGDYQSFLKIWQSWMSIDQILSREPKEWDFLTQSGKYLKLGSKYIPKMSFYVDETNPWYRMWMNPDPDPEFKTRRVEWQAIQDHWKIPTKPDPDYPDIDTNDYGFTI